MTHVMFYSRSWFVPVNPFNARYITGPCGRIIGHGA